MSGREYSVSRNAKLNYVKLKVSTTNQSRLCKADLSQDCGSLCAGRVRYIARKMMPCHPGHERECGSLFGFSWHAEMFRCRQCAAQGLQLRGQHSHQRSIARAAAGDDVVDGSALHLRQYKLCEISRNTLGSEGGRRSQCIFRLAAQAPTCRKKRGRILSPELLAPCCLWRPEDEVGIAQHLRQHRSKNLASRGNRSIAVVVLVKELLRKRINHHVAGAGVEGEYLAVSGAGGKGSQVCDAADVL